MKRSRRTARNNPIPLPLLAVAAAALGVAIVVVAKKASAKAPPVRVPPPGYDENGNPVAPTFTSPIQSGKPNVIVGPGPFDPVSTDWKRKNAPDWWPW